MTAWTERDVPSLQGKTALVTGANSGLGLETARVLAARGAKVLGACRDVTRARAVLGPLGVEVVELDLSRLASVRACGELVAARGRLDILVNNAGLMAIPFTRTPDGFEMQLGVNHLGHFALVTALWPVLAGARVVNVSSMYHRRGRVVLDDLFFERRPYRRWDAYAQTKLANVLFTLELARRAPGVLLPVMAHPGYAATNLQAQHGKLVQSRGELVVMKLANAVFAQSAAAGAWPQLRAATDPDAKPGDFFGPAGFNEMRGKAVLVKPEPHALDEALARGLWERSRELTGGSPGGL